MSTLFEAVKAVLPNVLSVVQDGKTIRVVVKEGELTAKQRAMLWRAIKRWSTAG